MSDFDRAALRVVYGAIVALTALLVCREQREVSTLPIKNNIPKVTD